MASIAELSTTKLIESYGKGEPMTIKEAVLTSGGSESYALNGKLTQTKTFKRGMSKYASKFAKPLEKSLKVLAQRDFSKEKTATLTDLAVKFNIQRRSELDLTTSDTPSVNQIVGMQFINVTQQATIPVAQPVAEHVGNTPKDFKEPISQNKAEVTEQVPQHVAENVEDNSVKDKGQAQNGSV